ncbi:hypothetical protein DV737_g2519, partial [Chaetothyriales sp. CBS 132003]
MAMRLLASLGRFCWAVFAFIFHLLSAILWSIVYTALAIASPFIYVGRLCTKTVLLPLRFLAQFEALWYFLGVAAVTGALFAAACHLVLRTCVWLFVLDSQPASASAPIPATGHDAISYRAARLAKRQRELRKDLHQAKLGLLVASLPVVKSPPPASGTSAVSPGTKMRSLTRETILEDSDEDDSDW